MASTVLRLAIMLVHCLVPTEYFHPLIKSLAPAKCQPVYFSKKAPHFSEVFKFLEAKLGTETEQPLREHNRSLEKEKVERNQFAWYEI